MFAAAAAEERSVPMKDDIENDNEAAVEVPAAEESQPRKIMLGKRVIRHFNVRSGVRAGLADDTKVSTLCIKSGVRCVG